jgi:stress-induced-phosphoprotein 1
MFELPSSSPWPWRLESSNEDGQELVRLLVTCPLWLASLADAELDLGPSTVQIRIAPNLSGAGEMAAGANVVLTLPPGAPTIDTDRATCKFAKKRHILTVSWPKVEAATTADLGGTEAAGAAAGATPAEDRAGTSSLPADDATATTTSPKDEERKADAILREDSGTADQTAAGDTAVTVDLTEKATSSARESAVEELAQKASELGAPSSAEEAAPTSEAEDENDDPEGIDVASWKAKGNAAFKAGDPAGAIVAYSKGIRAAGATSKGSAVIEEAHPEAFALFSNRALCAQQLGRFQAAAQDAEACVRLKPDFHKGYLRGGLALKSLGQPIEAFAFVDRAPPGLVMSNAELNALHEELQKSAAQEEERRLSEMSAPDQGKARGNALFKKAKFEEALKAYTAGYEACTEEERTAELGLNLLNNRAACHHQLSNYREVVRDTEMVLRVQPENLKARLRRMLALEPMEKYREAMADCRFVLSWDPQNDLANKMQHRLSKIVRDMDRSEAAH